MQSDCGGQIIARTGRLYVRELCVEDLDALYDIYNSWESLPGIYQLSGDRDLERVKLSSYIECMYGFYGVGLWAVCRKTDDRLVGHCGAWPSEIGDDWLLELGYILHRDCTGQGYGIECMGAIVDYIREETGFTKAAARIAPDNEKSLQLAQQLGMACVSADEAMCLYMLDITASEIQPDEEYQEDFDL